MSLLSTSHTFSFKRTKNILHTILLSICFVFANSAFATSNPSSSISQNTEVYLVTTDWIDSSSTLIFNPVSEKYFLSKTESSNSSLVLSQPFPNPDSDGDGIPDSVEDGSGYLSDLSIWLDANDAESISIDNNYTADEWRDKSGNERHVSNQVGDLLQGGVVYYVAPTPTDLDGDGKVDIGLICAVEDQSAAIEWILGGASQTTENGNTSTAIGTGQTNTTAMMNQAGYTGGAAQVADDYSVTDNGVTYNDWFLPSLEELNEMYSQKTSIEAAAGVTPFGANYWSSSEHNSNIAKSVDMSSGNDSNTNKNTQRNVRAIRTFSGGTGLSDPDTGFD